MVKEIVIYLEDLNFISIFLRVLMAVIFGGIIGYGREREKRPAGLRTHILVSVGATLAMITNIYLHKIYNGETDLSRLGAQVISGIGFLGAGTIIVTGKNKCMGLAIGAGFYSGAIIGCLVIAAVTVALANLDRKINRKSRNITLYILVNSTKAVSNLLKEIQSKNIKIRDIEISNNNVTSNEIIGILIGLKISRDVCPRNFIESISNKDEVIFFQEIN